MCQEIIFEYKELQREILGKIKVFVPFLMNLHMKFITFSTIYKGILQKNRTFSVILRFLDIFHHWDIYQ